MKQVVKTCVPYWSKTCRTDALLSRRCIVQQGIYNISLKSKSTEKTAMGVCHPGAAVGKEKWGLTHTPMASAGAQTYNGGLGAELPVGVQGAEPPAADEVLCLKQ